MIRFEDSSSYKEIVFNIDFYNESNEDTLVSL